MTKARTVPVLLLTGLILSACSGGSPSTPGTSAGPYGQLGVLQPGAKAEIKQKLRINIVTIGYRTAPAGQVTDPRQIDPVALGRELPETYNTLVRYPTFYGSPERTGNNFEFEYNYVAAPQNVEDDFFKFLTDNGIERAVKASDGKTYLNIAAAAYNCQDATAIVQLDPTPAGAPSPVYTCPTPAANIAREITGNYEVDGAKVEDWLGSNLSRAGVNPTEYTVVLVNWYGRPDFKFHSYSHLRDSTKETDTGRDFGARSSRRTIAWGGTASADQNNAKRLWFIDSSANPDYWTDSWDVTNADVDGDKVYDKRLPPIWEYGTRKASVAYGEKISADMGKVVRYVGINLLFTPSPLYRAALTPPDMPEKLNLDLAVEQGAGAVDIAKVLQPKVAQDRIAVLNPFVQWSNSVRSSPLSGDLFTAYKCQFPAPTDDACSPEYADPNGELFFQQALKDIRTRAQQAPGVYNIPNYLFNDGDPKAVNQGLLGRANSDGVTGTQAFIGNYLTPTLYGLGYGFTDTVVHETGHHLSLSHPHDGYDPEGDVDYGPSGATRFVDVGDESSTVMSYNNLAKEFGQFNLDAQYRYLTAAYITNANAVLSLSVAAGKVGDTRAAVVGADAKFAQAEAAYQARQYLQAAQLAHDAYRAVVDSAKAVGVSVQAYKWYERVDQLSVAKAKPNAANHMRPIIGQGPVLRPEETPKQRSNRLAP